jgi:hypothetical protein
MSPTATSAVRRSLDRRERMVRNAVDVATIGPPEVTFDLLRDRMDHLLAGC